MKSREKVIFDTNTIRNPDPKTFLGGREELKKFAKFSDIIFPEIVLDEMKAQKRKNLEKHKKSFLENPFHWLRELNQDDTENFDGETHVTTLESNEDIAYSVIKLTDFSVLEEMKALALKKLPPFEDSESTDKGFKDAYIYFTILEFIKKSPEEKIFICTKDGKLKDALKVHKNLVVIEDFESFRRESVSSFCDEYFISKLAEEVNPLITNESIIDFWENILGNKVVLIKVADGQYRVEVDSGEFVSYKDESAFLDLIQRLINSGNFSNTHSTVSELESYKNFFSDDEVEKILRASLHNSQIRLVLSDDDVKAFIVSLYEGKKDAIPLDVKQALEQYLSVKL